MRVPHAELHTVLVDHLSRAGVPTDNAALVADSLIDADERGVSSHGTARLHMYLDAIAADVIKPESEPVIETSSPASSLWDGQQSLGQISSAALIDHAVTRSQEVGAHVAVCHNANHFGAAGYWARRASRHGCVAMAFTTSHPLIVPTRGSRPELGTNPIAFSIEGETDEFVLDIATSTVALGKVEVAQRNGASLPDGWAVDPSGTPVRDPSAVYPDVLMGEVGGLLPVGGADETLGGHKGYGLAAMVEILCGVLGGGEDLTPGRPLADRTAGLWRVSHCFIVIDPEHLAGRQRTGEALDKMVSALRKSPPIDDDVPVLVHGDKERASAAAQTETVEIHDSVWEQLTP